MKEEYSFTSYHWQGFYQQTFFSFKRAVSGTVRKKSADIQLKKLANVSS